MNNAESSFRRDSSIDKHICPACGDNKVYRAYIEDGGQGDWCPNCNKSVQNITGQITSNAKNTGLGTFAKLTIACASAALITVLCGQFTGVPTGFSQNEMKVIPWIVFILVYFLLSKGKTKETISSRNNKILIDNANKKVEYQEPLTDSSIDIFKNMPNTKLNCRECGYPSCISFTRAFSEGKANLDSCPYVPNALREKYSK
jgi:hypothetical protein